MNKILFISLSLFFIISNSFAHYEEYSHFRRSLFGSIVSINDLKLHLDERYPHHPNPELETQYYVLHSYFDSLPLNRPENVTERMESYLRINKKIMSLLHSKELGHGLNLPQDVHQATIFLLSAVIAETKDTARRAMKVIESSAKVFSEESVREGAIEEEQIYLDFDFRCNTFRQKRGRN